MQEEPSISECYDTYEPQKYNCIAVDDDLIESIMVNLQDVDCYWHNLQRLEKGIAYCGVTLVPPKSLEIFINILSSQNKKEFNFLIDLANQAKENGKYIIHYGI